MNEHSHAKRLLKQADLFGPASPDATRAAVDSGLFSKAVKSVQNPAAPGTPQAPAQESFMSRYPGVWLVPPTLASLFVLDQLRQKSKKHITHPPSESDSTTSGPGPVVPGTVGIA